MPASPTPPPVRRGIRLAVVLGHAPPLVVLAAVAVVVMREADAVWWPLAGVAAAALLTLAGAWLTLDILRRATRALPPLDTRAATTQAADQQAEIDHRVRNTLQVIASLISLELRRVGPAGERAALLRVQSRLHSLSLVHRAVSAGDVAAPVRLDHLAADIADHLFGEDRHAGPMPGLDLSLDPVSGTPEQAGAFALYVNEALMQALNRHDPARSPVALSLTAPAGGGWVLSVSAALDAQGGHDGLSARLMANCAAQLGATPSKPCSADHYEVRLAMPL